MIFLLDDDPSRKKNLRAVCAPVVWAKSAEEGVSLLQRDWGKHRAIFLDHDLLPGYRPSCADGTGGQVAKWLAAQEPTCPVVVHSISDDAPDMVAILKAAGWSARYMPGCMSNQASAAAAVEELGL